MSELLNFSITGDMLKEAPPAVRDFLNALDAHEQLEGRPAIAEHDYLTILKSEMLIAHDIAVEKIAQGMRHKRDAAELVRLEQHEHGAVDSWLPLDPAEWLSGDENEDVPTIGTREDGVCLFYPGKTHSVIGATEAGKSWLALMTCAQEITAGNDVVYIDFEDSLAGVYSRLIDLVDDDSALKHFQYVRPAAPVSEGKLDRYSGCSLAIIDGITEGMNLHGLNPIDNMDVAKFNGKLPNPLAALGCAVVSIDHVVKDAKNAGKYPMGAVHKLNAISGASYKVENVDAFGVGQSGWSTVSVSKDRPGAVREHCLKDKGESYIASLHLRSAGRKHAPQVSLEVPAGKSFQPTVLMEKISDAVIGGSAGHGPYGKTELRALVQGKNNYKDQAIDALIDGGYLVNQGTEHRWAVVPAKRYEPDDAAVTANARI
jgi:hypothetical protein